MFDKLGHLLAHDMDGELKFFSTSVIDLDVDVSANIVASSVNLIAQGVGRRERIGRKIVVEEILWRYIYLLINRDAVTVPKTGNTIRIILYLDKQCNGTAALAKDILAGSSLLDFINVNNEDRFDLLMDEVHDINYQNMASDAVGKVSLSEVVHHGDFHLNCYIPIEFNGTDGNLDEITSNNIGVLVVGWNGDFTEFHSNIRLRFRG